MLRNVEILRNVDAKKSQGFWRVLILGNTRILRSTDVKKC